MIPVFGIDFLCLGMVLLGIWLRTWQLVLAGVVIACLVDRQSRR